MEEFEKLHKMFKLATLALKVEKTYDNQQAKIRTIYMIVF